MNQALLRIWDVCVFRAGPQDLPNSFYLLGVLIIGGYAIDLMLTQLLIDELMTFWYLRPVLWLVLIGGAIYGMLVYRGVPQRFLRTFTALVGSSLYLSAIALICSTFLKDIAGLVLAGLLVWQIVIHGRIIALALQTKILIGCAITVVLVFVLDAIAMALL